MVEAYLRLIKIMMQNILTLDSLPLWKVWILHEIELKACEMAITTPIYSQLQQLFSGTQIKAAGV